MGILTFDESPYKEYTVKASDTINLQYICFGEIGAERIYKGEGTMQLIAYYPFGICRKKSDKSSCWTRMYYFISTKISNIFLDIRQI